jgi:hypothetical protein
VKSNQKKDQNQTSAIVADEKAMAGVDKYLGSTTVQLQGKPYTAAAIKAVLQAEIDVTKALDQSKAEVRQEVANARPVRASARAMRKALGKYILSAFGTAAVQVFDDFGIPVPKAAGPKTAEVKADAIRKAVATKKARREALKKVQPVDPTLVPSTTPGK